MEKHYKEAIRKGFCWVNDDLKIEQHIFTEVVEGEVFICIPTIFGTWFIGYLGSVRFLWYAAPRSLQKSYNAIVEHIDARVPLENDTRIYLLEEIEGKVVNVLRENMLVFK